MKSIFKFQIAESINEVLNNLMSLEGFLYEKMENKIRISEDRENGTYASIYISENKIVLYTGWGCREYVFTANKNGGCTVIFDGPMAALLKQEILPQVTYVEKTLAGRFENTPFMPIADYMAFRINEGMELPTGGLDLWVIKEIPFLSEWVEYYGWSRDYLVFSSEEEKIKAEQDYAA